MPTLHLRTLPGSVLLAAGTFFLGLVGENFWDRRSIVLYCIGVPLCVAGVVVLKPEWQVHWRVFRWRLRLRVRVFIQTRQPLRLFAPGLPRYYQTTYSPPVSFLIPHSIKITEPVDQFYFSYTPLGEKGEYYAREIGLPLGEWGIMVNWLPTNEYIQTFRAFVDPPDAGLRIIRNYNPYIGEDSVDWHGTMRTAYPIPGRFPGDTVFPLGWLVRASKKGTFYLVIRWRSEERGDLEGRLRILVG